MEIKVLKGLLGMDESDTAKDNTLQFILDDVAETIKNYCNLDTVPAGLEKTAYRMAMDIYRNEQPGESETPLAVKSISEGDTSTSFGTVESSSYAESVLKDYRGQLNRYRRVVF